MKRALIIPVMTLMFLLMHVSLTYASGKDMRGTDKKNIPSFVGYASNRIVVKFDPSIVRTIKEGPMISGKTGIPSLDQIGKQFKIASIRPQFPGAKKKKFKGKSIDLAGWHKIRFSGKVDIMEAVEKYKKTPGVLDAQPVGIHTITVQPNDEFYDVQNNTEGYSQWHLSKIEAPAAWDIETGSPDIIVAVADSGVRYVHKDLAGAYASYSNPAGVNGNIWINQVEKNGQPGIDDDGNGFVDDWVGWDFVDDTSLVDPAIGFSLPCYPGEDCGGEDNDPSDFNGHGTHCAGIIAANTNNGYNVASLAGGWGNGNLETSGNGVKVMCLRIGWSAHLLFFEIGLVPMDYAAEAMYYAADNGAHIISCSWTADNSGGISDAVDYFLASGGLIFKASGNESNEVLDYFATIPSEYVIDVAATDQNDCKASFSKYGAGIDISAPGVNIMSLFHDNSDPENDHVAAMDGTSMAAPLAAGLAALIWSQNPSWSASQVKQRLLANVDPIDDLPCNSTYAGKLGAGRINAFKAVYPAPLCDFAAGPTCCYVPLSVSFTDQSTGEIDSWLWDFGDGTISTDQHPVHIYDIAGSYTVSLIVSGPYGSDDEAKTDLITVTEPGIPPLMEVGEASLDHNWEQVDFTQPYSDPIVVSKPLSYNGSDPSVVRMRNVSSTGFEISVQEWNYLDQKHDYKETVSYLAMESGRYMFIDGSEVEAGMFETDETGSFMTVSFKQPFREVPVVIAAVGSFNGTDTVTNRLCNINTYGFDFRMQEQELNVQEHFIEKIYYIAWEPVSGYVNGLRFEINRTSNEITDQFCSFPYGTQFAEPPMFIADMQTTNGSDPATVRWQNKDAYMIEIKVEEEKSKDSETTHTEETIGYMAFASTISAGFSATPVCGEAPLSVIFTDESSGAITSWSWDFDNNGTVDSCEQNPLYTYNTPGIYTVKLTISDPYIIQYKIKTDFVIVTEPGLAPTMEAGEVNVDHNWLQVDFTQPYSDPIVVAKPLSYNGTEPSVVRMRNVSSTGFEIRVQEWNYLNQIHDSKETVGYLAMESGHHMFTEGMEVESGKFVTNATGSFIRVNFEQPFREMPVIIAAVGSFGGTDTVTDRLRNISTEGFEFRMQEQELNAQVHDANETIFYIAMEPGAGCANGFRFEINRTANEVTDQFYPISYSSQFINPPVFLADMQTTKGTDTAAVRWKNKDAYMIEVKIEEEKSKDSETVHIEEIIGYMAFSVE
ncbi:MAG: S8 family serine peptidase [bacterium]